MLCVAKRKSGCPNTVMCEAFFPINCIWSYYTVSPQSAPPPSTSEVYVQRHRYTLTGRELTTTPIVAQHCCYPHVSPQNSTKFCAHKVTGCVVVKWKKTQQALLLRFHPWRSSFLPSSCCVFHWQGEMSNSEEIFHKIRRVTRFNVRANNGENDANGRCYFLAN